MSLDFILGGLTLVSLAITLWQWIVARHFPLHRRVADPAFAPGIAVLKPLKGCDAETASCLRSWLDQDYAGTVQVLFGIDSLDDPAAEVSRALLAAYPHRDVQLVVCPDALGPNAKVATLAQLEGRIQCEVVIISDADVRVPRDFLANVVAPLRDPGVGLVNCFYRLANPTTLAMKGEAIAINADFWSQVLQSQSLKPLDFALGAVMATRRQQLEAIGGFAALAEYLADDYELGHRIATSGQRMVLSTVVVECWSRPLTFRQVWSHQLRWARTIRVCQPLPYFFSILSNATLWPALWLIWRLASVCMAVERAPRGTPGFSLAMELADITLLWALPLGALCLAVRILTAMNLQAKLTQTKHHYPDWWLVPIKDLLGAAVWALAFLGQRIEWSGKWFRVLRGGKLVAD